MRTSSAKVSHTRKGESFCEAFKNASVEIDVVFYASIEIAVLKGLAHPA
jgi:hypothetical protein